MARYFFRRLLGLVPLFVGITFVSFLVVHLAPGSAVDAAAGMDPKMSAAVKEKLTRLYGLDRPVTVQYADWMSHLVRLDFGASFSDGRPVIQKIGEAVPVTLGINLLALFFIFLAGIPLGVFGAVRRGGAGDKASTVLTFAAFSIPTFWLSLLLMSFFGVRLGWLPVSGVHSVFFEDLTAGQKAADVARHLVLPVFVASFTGVAGLSRYMRSGMADALRKPYVRTARAKGLSERRVLYGHTLPNALLPVITVLGLSVPGLLGGSVIFETIFSIPGMGRLFFNSVFMRDYPVIMGVLVLGACLTLIGNFLADLCYAIADPRIRVEARR